MRVSKKAVIVEIFTLLFLLVVSIAAIYVFMKVLSFYERGLTVADAYSEAQNFVNDYALALNSYNDDVKICHVFTQKKNLECTFYVVLASDTNPNSLPQNTYPFAYVKLRNPGVGYEYDAVLQLPALSYDSSKTLTPTITSTVVTSRTTDHVGFTSTRNFYKLDCSKVQISKKRYYDSSIKAYSEDITVKSGCT